MSLLKIFSRIKNFSQRKTFMFSINKKEEEPSMDQRLTLDLSVLILRESGGWAAQCLEYDIAAQGRTKAKAKQAFEKTLIGQLIVDIKYDKIPLEGIPRAPKMYWDMIERAQSYQERKPLYMPDNVSPILAAANYLQVAAA
jgi:hypothetical protein